MTSPKTAALKTKAAQTSVPGHVDSNATDLPPLKPRPVLFVLLAILLAIWLGALGLMRLKTVIRPEPQQPFPQLIELH